VATNRKETAIITGLPFMRMVHLEARVLPCANPRKAKTSERL